MCEKMSFEKYVRSGRLQRNADSAVEKAARDAERLGLRKRAEPVASPAQAPSNEGDAMCKKMSFEEYVRNGWLQRNFDSAAEEAARDAERLGLWMRADPAIGPTEASSDELLSPPKESAAATKT